MKRNSTVLSFWKHNLDTGFTFSWSIWEKKLRFVMIFNNLEYKKVEEFKYKLH